jgi:spermidine synthase
MDSLDDRRSASNGVSFFPVITASGFAATVAQIVLLRELLVLFYGIELYIGAVLTVWLLGGALGSRLSVRLAAGHPSKEHIQGLVLISALILPTTLLLIRASSHLLGLVSGNILPLTKLLQICFVATFPCAFVSGALFGLCWFFSKKINENPMKIYMGEALGATVGGLFFYLLVILHQSTLSILLFASLILLFTAALVFRKVVGKRGRVFRAQLYLTGVIAAAMIAALFFQKPLDHLSRRWQWGPDFKAAADTAYQNLVVLHRDRQDSVFANGLWLFSSPDRQSVEYAVHPPLLQHPSPKSVLVLGGVPAGLPEEILRHPSVRSVTAVELDPALVRFTATYLSARSTASSSEKKVRMHYQDAALFLRTDHTRYDVILMNVGDPINAQFNRFYTTSFFSEIKSHLAPGGIYSFGVSGGEEMLGEVQIEFLGTVYRTLDRTFSTVSVLPGDPVRFFAAGSETRLTDNPQVLSDRIHERGLDLSYVRKDTLLDRFEAFRLRYFNTLLEDSLSDRINRDFTPLCYAHALQLWAQQWHPLLGKTVQSITRISPTLLWILFLSICILSLVVFRTGKYRGRRAVCLSVAVVGGLCMVAQMVMLIVFQIIKSALFLHLALIVALFMAGLAGGAAWMSSRRRTAGVNTEAGKLLIRIQTLICFFPCVLAALFLLLHGPLRDTAGSNLPVFLFPGFSLIMGLLEGAHFAAATSTMAGLGQAVPAIGGRLYAFDLLGSAGGLLVATFFLVPVIGPVGLLPMLSVASATSLVVLLSARPL